MKPQKRKRPKTGGVAPGTFEKKTLTKKGIFVGEIMAFQGRKHEPSNEAFAHCVAALLQYLARPDAEIVSPENQEFADVQAANSPHVIRDAKTESDAKERLEWVVEFILGWLTKDADDARETDLPERLRALANLIESRPIKKKPFPRPKGATGPSPIPTYILQPADPDATAVLQLQTAAIDRILNRDSPRKPGVFRSLSEQEIRVEINAMTGAEREEAILRVAPNMPPKRIARLVKTLFNTPPLPKGPRRWPR